MRTAGVGSPRARHFRTAATYMGFRLWSESYITIVAACCVVIALAGCQSGSGGGSEALPARQFEYVSNGITPGQISGFSIAQNGALSAVPGSPYREGGEEPYSLAATPSGKFLYVVNRGDETISAYNINPSDGSLAVVSGSPFRGPVRAVNPMYVAVAPSGKYLYVTNSAQPGAVTGFSIDPQSGALRLVAGSPFEGVNSPEALAFSPSGRFLFVSNKSGTISAFMIDPETGGLSAVPGSPFAGGMGGDGIAVSPSGKFLYASDPYNANIVAFAINPATGALTRTAAGPFATASHPAALAVAPSGILYVTHETLAGGISAFTIDENSGQLTQIAGSPFATGGTPIANREEPSTILALASAGRFLYVPIQDKGVAGFEITGNGALRPLSGSPFEAGPERNGIAIAAIR
jgi:6-phosphogluconolactonase (cycloisomerase 2 family)